MPINIIVTLHTECYNNIHFIGNRQKRNRLYSIYTNKTKGTACVFNYIYVRITDIIIILETQNFNAEHYNIMCYKYHFILLSYCFVD